MGYSIKSTIAYGIECVCLVLIRSYQLLISPLFQPVCRFTPSCSEYARQAIGRHGPYKGLTLFLKRLLKCHPFNPGGYDPVP